MRYLFKYNNLILKIKICQSCGIRELILRIGIPKIVLFGHTRGDQVVEKVLVDVYSVVFKNAMLHHLNNFSFNHKLDLVDSIYYYK